MTIYEIAKIANVSTATVSRVLNNSSSVNQTTRKRVQEIIEKYSFHPSLIAKGMSGASMKTVGIVTENLREVHHMTIAHSIEEYFSNLSYNVVMYDLGNANEESLSLFFSRVEQIHLDGILFIGSAFSILENNSERVKNLISSLPVIIINGWIEGSYGILVDEKKGMEEVFSLLYEKGRRRFLYLSGNKTESAKNKKEGFIKAFLSKKDPKSERKELFVGHEEEEIIKVLEENYVSFSPDAIIADEDIVAIFTLKYLTKIGISCPKDISLTGFNNSILSDLTYPPITSVDNKPEEQGEYAAHLLEKILKDKVSILEKKIVKRIEPELKLKGTH